MPMNDCLETTFEKRHSGELLRLGDQDGMRSMDSRTGGEAGSVLSQD